MKLGACEIFRKQSDAYHGTLKTHQLYVNSEAAMIRHFFASSTPAGQTVASMQQAIVRFVIFNGLLRFWSQNYQYYISLDS